MDKFAFLKKNQIALRQDQDELEDVCKYLASKSFNLLLEIGSFQGGSAIILSALLEPGSTIILIDPLLRGEKATEAFKWSCNWLEEQGFKVYPFIGMSHDLKIQKKIYSLIKDFHVGLLYIDGDHHTRNVLDDFHAFADTVETILFHDVIKNHQVNTAWHHIYKKRYKSRIFHNKFGTNWATGIGILESI